MKQIILYGVAGPSESFRVVRYRTIYSEEISIREINYQTKRLRESCPNIRIVYAIDNRHGLRRDYMDAVHSNSIEGWAIFKDILEREGMNI